MTENPQPSPDKRRKTWPIYQIRDQGDIVEMVEDPDTGEWWFRHSSIEKNIPIWIPKKGARSEGQSQRKDIRKMGPWIKPIRPCGVGHTPGQRAKRLPNTWAMLPPLPERPVAASAGLEPAPVRALGYFDASDQYVPYGR